MKIDDKTAPRLLPLTETELSQRQAEILAAMNFSGKTANIFATAVRSPDMFEAWNHFGMYILRGSSLPPRDRELLILRSAWVIRCEYEFAQHNQVGRSVGLTAEEIRRITVGPDAPGWDAFEAALLRAADELHRDSAIADATWDILSARYSEKQLFDLIMTVGQYTMAAMLMKTLRIQLDEGLQGFDDILNIDSK